MVHVTLTGSVVDGYPFHLDRSSNKVCTGFCPNTVFADPHRAKVRDLVNILRVVTDDIFSPGSDKLVEVRPQPKAVIAYFECACMVSDDLSELRGHNKERERLV